MKLLLPVFLTLCLYAGPSQTFAQSHNILSPGYYIVVGAYASSRENIAQNYVDILSSQGFTAAYGYNSSTHLFLVYIEYFDNLKTALQKMYRTRDTEKFKDAWVRVVPGDVSKPLRVAEKKPEQIPTPAFVQEGIVSALPAKKSPEFIASADSVVLTHNDDIRQYQQITLGNTEVFLSLFHAQNNRIVDGEVQVIDTDRAKFITKVKGNEYLLLPDPKSNSGKLSLICEAFGYRKMQEELNYPVPLADTVKPFIDLMGTTIVVRFDLVRYYKGDKAIMYNVYFYNDAAVMAPESKYELNSLLQMMQEIPTYKIRLHGHTNGNYNGRIITMGPDKDFFSLTGSSNTVGSAKDLSRMRAEIIRDYLVLNGISPDRVSVKAWGGKRPLFDKNSVNAKKNVRVEVEILDK